VKGKSQSLQTRRAHPGQPLVVFSSLETGESLDIAADDVALENFLQGCDDRQVRRAATIFARLQPYHLFCRNRWQEAHVPEIVHPGVYYPGEQGLWERSDEFLYGPDILVVPFKEDKGKALYGPRELILPSDGWVHLWTSRVYPGGQTFVDTQAARPAVFVSDRIVNLHGFSTPLDKCLHGFRCCRQPNEKSGLKRIARPRVARQIVDDHNHSLGFDSLSATHCIQAFFGLGLKRYRLEL